MMALTLAAAAIALAAPTDAPLPLLVNVDGRCYRVSALDTGPGGIPYAWLVALEPPRGVLHLPSAELERCAPCSMR